MTASPAGNGSSNMQGTSNEGYEANEKPDERNTYFMAEINVPDSNNVSVTPGPRMQKALPFRRLQLSTSWHQCHLCLCSSHESPRINGILRLIEINFRVNFCTFNPTSLAESNLAIISQQFCVFCILCVCVRLTESKCPGDNFCCRCRSRNISSCRNTTFNGNRLRANAL